MDSKESDAVLDDATSQSWFDRRFLEELPALLVGVYQSKDGLPQVLEHLQELKLLAQTHGIAVIDQVAFAVRTFNAATFLSTGKLEELQEAIVKLGAKLVIFDDEIAPAQQRNLEQFLKVAIIDRTEVILGVFADRAKTREAKLQIELAKVKYMAPRLKHLWTHFSKQTGGGGGATGGGYLRGAGERQIEVDRRLLKKHVALLQKEIESVRKIRHTQRGFRERNEIPLFAIVGYTNAGKSTLMKAVTAADVLIEDKLFATLDTTTRKFQLPESHQEVLMIDTVGFIRKLPHLLVMSFRSTLEEAASADILIHVIDASHPQAPEQAEITLNVLKELGAGRLPVITVFNKMDQVREGDAVQKGAYRHLRLTYPRSVEMCAQTGEGLDLLFAEMEHHLQNRLVRLKVSIPQSEYHLVSKLIHDGHVLSKEYEENSVLLEVELPRPLSFAFEKYRI